MILRSQYNKIISEHFDIMDNSTRRALLSIDEADQNMVLSSLSAKLYHMIVEKVDDIDYGDIPKSKGDITRIPNFINIKECLDTIRGLLVQFNQDTTPADDILKAIDNLRDSRAMWEKAYAFNSQIAILLYETMALSVVSAVSFLISTSIEYIKEPETNSYQISLDKVGYAKSKNCLLYKNIAKFNKAYSKGEIKKAIEPLLLASNKVRESCDIVNELGAAAIVAGVVTAGVLVSMVGLIIPILHELVTLFFCAKQSVSEYFDIQADLLALNAESVRLDYTKTESERDKIYNKQRKLVDKFKAISNKLAVKLKSAEKRGETLVKKENSTKYKMEDVVNTMPTSASSMF